MQSDISSDKTTVSIDKFIKMLKKFFIFQFLISAIWARDSLGPNECLAQGESLTSANGCFKLIMQGDGNLVIYRQSNNRATWSSKTSRTCTNRACMQGDGNFVTYDCQNKATWSSKTSKKEGSWVILQNDGNMVVYAWQSNRALWASNSVTYC